MPSNIASAAGARAGALTRGNLTVLIGGIVLVLSVAAHGANRALVVVPNVPAASAGEPAKVSPYSLAMRRQHREELASGVNSHELPTSMRQGREGFGRSTEQATPKPRQ